MNAITELSERRRKTMLWLLFLICTLNFVDRQIVTILAEPIKREFHLSDWQIGAMTGLSFALFYTVMGIPIARLAERHNRGRIIAGSVAAWSLFTIACGLGTSFVQLLLCRVGVGIGEAGCTPAAHSLISDTNPREKRGSALALYSLGFPVGGLIGMALGGLIADRYGWRTAFISAGVPGLALAGIALLVLVDPRNPATVVPGAVATTSFRELQVKRSYWLITLGIAVKSMLLYGFQSFVGPFFLRVHGPELATIATYLGIGATGVVGLGAGLAIGAGGVIGTVVGGRLADSLVPRSVGYYAIIPAVSTILEIPFYLLVLTHASAVGALALLVIPSALAAVPFGPSYAAIQGLVSHRSRATASAVMLLVVTLVGLGIGPMLIGACSDWLSAPDRLGSVGAIRGALIMALPLDLLGAALLWRASRRLADETIS